MDREMIDALLQDLRYAARRLVQAPGFTAIAVLTLALGIGPTTAIFSVIDTLMLRPLPYSEAERIVTLWQNDARNRTARDEVAPGNFLDWRDRATAFSMIAAADPYAYSLITPEGRPEAVFAARVTEGFFDILGMPAFRGQLFTAEHHRPKSGNFAAISYGLWQRRFGGDAKLVGSSISLDGEPFVVLGVLPPDFDVGMFRDVPGERSVWVARQEEGWERRSRPSGWWNVIARLKPGLSLEQARADLDRVAAGIAAELPATNATAGVTVAPLRDHLVGNARTPLLVLLSAVGLVLLIACANVANLLLARGTEREREFAVRTALGAQRGRLTRQLLTESVLLGVLGGTLGVLLAFWGVDLIKSLAPADIPRIHAVTVDLRILAFALVMTLATALVFGLAPASQSWRASVQSALKSVHGIVDPARLRLRAGLIVSEIALALTLLVGAGLLLRSFAALVVVDPGFQKEGVVALQVFAWDRRDSLSERVRFFEETELRFGTLPGVTSVGSVMNGPFTTADIGIRRALLVEGREAARSGEEMRIFVNHATPSYFGTMGIPVIHGRGFDATDRAGTPYVAVINDAARRVYWRGSDPLGDRVRLGEDKTQFEIVGVVGDTRLKSLEQVARPEVYLAQRQSGYGGMTYYVRTTGDLAATIEAAKREVWAVDPLQDFYQTATLENLMATTLAPRRFSLLLLGAFAVIALLLAAVGIYGVINFVVKQRTHEMGIRLALGAAPRNVVRLVVTHGLRLAVAGLVLGLAGALAASRALASMLFDITAWDGATFAVATATLLFVALLAAYLPARRASQVDPMVALRTE
jgi:putative ABC transport system permease protein